MTQGGSILIHLDQQSSYHRRRFAEVHEGCLRCY